MTDETAAFEHAVQTELLPISTLDVGKIHQGDCIELMQRIDSGTIDLVFADPPFNIGYEYDQYHDRQEDEQYIDWSRQWMEEVHRILKPGGTFWLAIGDEYAAELKVDAEHKIGFSHAELGRLVLHVRCELHEEVFAVARRTCSTS